MFKKILVIVLICLFSLGCTALIAKVPADEDVPVDIAGPKPSVWEKAKYGQKIQMLENKVRVLKREVEAQKRSNKLLRVSLDKKKELINKLKVSAKDKIRMPTSKEIQIALREVGFYKGVIDGTIGGETKQALMQFQKSNGLTPDGVVGSKTWDKLKKFVDAY